MAEARPTPALRIGALPLLATRFVPGLMVCAMVAVCAAFFSEHYGGPPLIFALAFGMALNFLSTETRCAQGVDFAAKSLLRFAVALFGARVSFSQVGELTMPAIGIVAASVVLIIGFGLLGARLLKQPASFGLLSGGAVAICGASAALAIAAVLFRDGREQRTTAVTVAAVTALATFGMTVYPLIARALGFGTVSAGFFLGGSIHDVAQVVAAGLLMSQEVADIAIYVKMIRVAMLVPVVALISIWCAYGTRERAQLPGFLVAFVCLAIANQFHLIPADLGTAMNTLSRALLTVAVAAIGIRTALSDWVSVGWRPLLLICLETALLAALMIGAVLMHWVSG